MGIPDSVTEVRLVACDLDGTLVGRDNRPSAVVLRAVAALRAAGCGFTLVTGRPPRLLRPAARALHHAGLSACANGAVIWDHGTEEPVATDCLGPADLTAVRAAADTAGVTLTVAVETVDACVVESGYPPDERDEWAADEQTWRSIVDHHGPIAKVMCRLADAAAVEAFDRALPAGLDVHPMRRSPPLVEVRRSGVSKASGLAELARRAGVDRRHVLAVGDGIGDVPMLRWAGIGVALGGSHPAAAAAADVSAPAFGEDGVAHAI